MGIVLKRYKVTATKDVGYETFILAKDEDEAWGLANQEDLEWSRVDDGHDWTIENVTEERDKVKSRSEVLPALTNLYYVCVNSGWSRMADVISTAEDVARQEVKHDAL